MMISPPTALPSYGSTSRVLDRLPRARGEVRDAIVNFLRLRPEGATVREITDAVQQTLAGPLGESSIRSSLREKNGKLYERIGPALYRLHPLFALSHAAASQH